MSEGRATQRDAPDENQEQSRFVVGIDLGTTNSAVCFVDASEQPWRVRTFLVPQVVAPGQVEARETLPSFHYQAASSELPPGGLRLPWGSDEALRTVGVFAREQGRLVPGRLIDSAKSWLCHGGVDRTARILPWHGESNVERLSPVEVSAQYLQHVREAWDAEHPEFPLAEQDVVLTLPASFDEVARRLTIDAARVAGLPRVVLVEEPQAAFYSWLDAHREDWEQRVSPGQTILVCDIGGGTTDFTLIRVRRGTSGDVEFLRVAVGDHLILGGDNLDLALAQSLERRLAGNGKLEPRQWSVLVRTCRYVKETLLSPNAPERMTVNLPGSGAKLIGGALQVEVCREEVQQLLVEGFLPSVPLDAKPVARKSGFQEFGLPYAADHAVTRYMAAFLTAHRDVARDKSEDETDHDPARPDVVLFNGGFFASEVLRRRLLAVLSGWFSTEDTPWEPLVLENARLDLAVARGAAYYGMVRRGEGLRIVAGLPRTYYIGVEAEPPTAVCLVPAGMEPGDAVGLTSRPFELRVAQPVEFPLYVSSVRLTDEPGAVVPVDPEHMTALPPIRTVLQTSRRRESDSVSVHLHARLTEIGTLELWCSESEGRRSWQLQFDVRSATQTDMTGHVSAAEREGIVERESVKLARRVILGTFGPDGIEKPAGLPKRIAASLEISRKDWPTSLLRSLWETLMEIETERRRSVEHEARWLNLLGFSLRPGFGFALDDWRVAETWRVVQANLFHAAPRCWAEWWILWRRVAGGLTPGQQTALASPLLKSIRQRHRQLTTGRGKGADFASSSHEEAEIWRMLGALECLDLATKTELGRLIIDLLPKRRMQTLRPAMAWALGRIGARVPLYGPLNTVIAPEVASQWLTALIELDDRQVSNQVTVMQMARCTGDRYRDVSDATRQRIIDWLEASAAPDHFLTLVSEGGTLESSEQEMVFGESLPMGLRIL